MRKRIILFIIPVVAFLIMATALVLSTAASSFAKGASHTNSKTTPISVPALPSGGMQPNWSSYH